MMPQRFWIGFILALTIFLPGRVVAFVNGQNAAYVLGEPNFTSVSGNLSRNGMNSPQGVLFDTSTARLFVADVQNNRVLVYDFNLTPLLTTPAPIPASYVLGQPDFVSNGAATTRNGMNGPINLAYDASNQRLFVSDGWNHRVLVYDFTLTPLTNPAPIPASVVLGQPNFNTNSQNTTQSGLSSPAGLAYDPSSHSLFVGDDRRILVFDVDPLFEAYGDGMNAYAVLGEPDFTSMNMGTSQTLLLSTLGLAYDSSAQQLFATDMINERVLVYDFTITPLTNPAPIPASFVLGQPDFTSRTAQYGAQNSEVNPVPVSLDPVSRRLFVGGSNGVIEYDLWGGITNDMNAAHVLGGPNFLGPYRIGVTAGSMFGANGLAYDPTNRRLFVVDDVWDRVLVFDENNLGGTPNACPSGPAMQICGTVVATEDGVTTLPGVPVELRDWHGTLLTTQKTNDSGAYSFTTGLTAGNTYYINPVIDRTQSAIPTQYPIQSLPGIGAQANLALRGWPGTLQVNTAGVGSFILISTTAYSGSNAPTMSPALGSSGFYTLTAKGDGTAALSASPGSYYMTCWQQQLSNGSVTYIRNPATSSSGPYATSPNQVTIIPACGS